MAGIKRRAFLGTIGAAVAAIPAVKLEAVEAILRGAPKIFAMNDFDWVVAWSLEEAKTFYREMIGDDDYFESVTEDDAPYELPDESLDKFRFHREDEYGNWGEVVSFRAPCKEHRAPCADAAVWPLRMIL
jgi:hypothetical protein